MQQTVLLYLVVSRLQYAVYDK